MTFYDPLSAMLSRRAASDDSSPGFLSYTGPIFDSNEEIFVHFNLIAAAFVLLFFLASLPYAIPYWRGQNIKRGWYLSHRASDHIRPEPSNKSKIVIQRSASTMTVSKLSPKSGGSAFDPVASPSPNDRDKSSPTELGTAKGGAITLYRQESQSSKAALATLIRKPSDMQSLIFAKSHQHARKRISWAEKLCNRWDRPVITTYLTIAQVALLLMIIGGMVVVWVIEKSFGALAYAMFPLIFALASKSSILGGVLGKGQSVQIYGNFIPSHIPLGHERLNWIHRTFGRLCFLSMTVHALAYFNVWFTTNGGFSLAMEDSQNKWGPVAYGGAILMVVFSMHPVRSRIYKIFRCTHWIGIGLMFAGVGLQYTSGLA